MSDAQDWVRVEDPRTFVDSLGCFATGVTVVTGIGGDGELLGVTANSFNSVSLDPPLVLFSLSRLSGTLAALRISGAFAVNVLNEGQQDLAHRFSTGFTKSWDGVSYEVWGNGAPILSGALANLECRTYAMHEIGDHVLVIGEVERIQTKEDGRPLLFFRKRYRDLEKD
jgi:flavin reductase (DIM6/NTAB) family NADH-FMN oxidoreductase RutF